MSDRRSGRRGGRGPVRVLELEVNPPFRLDLTAWTLRRRQHNTIDRWDGERYRRTLVVGDRPVEVSVHQQHGTTSPLLAVELRGASRLSDDTADEARRILERTLGVGVDLSDFYRLADGDPRLSELARNFSGMRPPRFPSVFEAVVNAVACQQLSLVVGIHLLNRLSDAYGPTVPAVGMPEGGTPTAGFPTPVDLAGADTQDLRELGFSQAKARAIITLAGQVASGEMDLEALRTVDDERALVTLLEIRGVGRWSAEYTLLRGLGRWSVLPGDDVGARNNLRRRFDLPSPAGYEALAQLGRAWWPWGGLVYFHLLLDSLAAAGLVEGSPGPTGG